MSTVSQSQLDDLKAQVEQCPDFPDLWLDYAVGLIDSGRSEDALIAVETALELHPTYRRAASLRAFMLAEHGVVDEGLRQLRAAFSGEANGFDAAFAIGTFGMRHGGPDWGAEQLERAAQMRPSPYSAMHAGAAYESLGDSERAKTWHKVAGRFGVSIGEVTNPWEGWTTPALGRVQILIARDQVRQGQANEARQTLANATIVLPGHPDLLRERAVVEILDGQLESAQEILEEMVRLAPFDGRAFRELADVATQQGDTETAVDHLHEAIRLRPLFVDYRYELAATLEERGQFEEAISHYRLIRTLHPTYEPAALGLARSLHAVGVVDTDHSAPTGPAAPTSRPAN